MRPIALPMTLPLALLLTGTTRSEGVYARAAWPIWREIAGAVGHPWTVRSPDKATTVAIRYDEQGDSSDVTMTVTGRIGTGRVRAGPGVDAEMLWAPDSSAFAITSSDGGAVGTYHAIVVGKGPNAKPISRDLSPLVIRAFGRPVTCDEPEDPNVAAVKWLSGSHLIVTAEIPPHTNCDSFGTFRAYEIDWHSMRVVRSYDQIAAKRLFGQAMGSELRNAPDSCVRRPRSCWVSTNHPGARR